MANILFLIKNYFIVIFSFSIILVYQNCSAPIDNFDSSLASLVHKDQFPYEIKMDTVAYSSCSEMTGETHLNAGQRFSFINEGYFTFKIGGYGSQGGIRYKDEFAGKLRYLNSSDGPGFLSRQPLTSVYLNLNVRDQFKLTQYSGSYEAEHWESGVSFLNTFKKNLTGDQYFLNHFGEEEIRTVFLNSYFNNNKQSLWIQNFGELTNQNQFLESALFWGDLKEISSSGASSSAGMRTFFSDSSQEGHLTVNFSTEGESKVPLKFQGGGDYQALGSSFRFNFSGKALSEILERDLSAVFDSKKSLGSYESQSWNCPDSLNLKIVPYYAKSGSKIYDSKNIPYLLQEPTESYLNQFLSSEEAKRVSRLLLGNWYVNLDSTKRVIIKKPKIGSTLDPNGSLCYSPTKLLEYSSKSSFPWDNSTDAHYISICLKK